jgi:hypothetical protein
LLGWVVGALLTAFMLLRVFGTIWCLIDLRRHWRGVPELWGVDWLDVVYRVEREFGVRLSAADFAGIPAHARISLTAGQLWEVVVTKLRLVDKVPPPDGWGRLVRALSEALCVKPKRVEPGSRLYADLGMQYGLE